MWRRLLPMLAGIGMGLAVLAAGLGSLHGIFVREREDARRALEDRRCALELYARQNLTDSLRRTLEEARPRIQQAAADPLRYTARSPVELHVEARKDGATVLRFSDNGVGIPRESWEAVFEEFRRLQREGLPARDYVAKPYRLRELLARIRVLARRGTAAAPPEEVLSFDRFRVDLASRRLLDASGQPLELTRTEFDLLVYLLRNAGKALTRDQILSSVWGEDTVVDAHTVDNFVSNLRKKLEWTSGSRFEIRSVRGVGYRMDLHG